MATTWSIARRAGACALTERPFEDGERHISLLRVREGALERVDLCMSAWRDERQRMESGGDEPLLYWTTHHEVTKKKTVQIDLESLERLFVQLEGREELAVRELRYVLCLLLMRKRRVKVERVLRKDGEESFLVKRPRIDERYTVYVYDFEPEQLEALRAQLQAVFDGAEGPHGVRLGPEDEDDVDEGGLGQAEQGPKPMDGESAPAEIAESSGSYGPAGAPVATGGTQVDPDPAKSDG